MPRKQRSQVVDGITKVPSDNSAIAYTDLLPAQTAIILFGSKVSTPVYLSNTVQSLDLLTALETALK